MTNPHRTALLAVLSERRRYVADRAAPGSGTPVAQNDPVHDVIRTCETVLAVGDGEDVDDEPDVELVTQAEIDERRDARWRLDDLRHGLAHVLGRRTRTSGIAAAFGMAGSERITLPADEILIDDVRSIRLAYDRLAATVREVSGSSRSANLDTLVRKLHDLHRLASISAEWPGVLAEAIGWDDDTEPEPGDVAEAIEATQRTAAEQRLRADRLHMALAVLAGYEPSVHVDPEALLLSIAETPPGTNAGGRAVTEYRSTDPHTDETED